ncbi:T-cell immunoglobulin and mucin domain-containing protein 2-like [Toxotes jaculatrix]|uniref:T-cell immunoglobulin and mucin domain-containing protein 2-like n=1 Tax=Toxotes jaculatrix TaxID=941984 RepID=UPI001B3B11D2|nr:T-cell immunoglobulin and mucin domain-containing protein 2-like [Toxotes jaculatrix]
MNVRQVLLLCFLTALCGGKPGLVRAQVNIYTGAAGGNGSINCHLTPPGSWKFFCKGECKGEDVLIKTDGVRADKGRYSVKYKMGDSGKGILTVTITHLGPSDSGRYRCGLGGSGAPASFADFDVRVSDALLDMSSGFKRTDIEGQNVTYPCFNAVNRSTMFFCKGECKKEEDILVETDRNEAQSSRYGIKYTQGSVFGLYVTISQVVKSDTAQYKCGYGRALSPDLEHTFSIIVLEAPTPSKPSQTLHPFTTSVPSASTPPPPPPSPPSPPSPTTATTTATTQCFSFSPESSASSSVAPDTTEQPAAAASTTSKPSRTLRPSPASTPSASTATSQSSSTSSGSSTAAGLFSDSTPEFEAVSHVPHPGYFLPLVVCVPVLCVLLAAAFLLFLKHRRPGKINSHNAEFPITYKKLGPFSRCEDSTYKTSREQTTSAHS